MDERRQLRRQTWRRADLVEQVGDGREQRAGRLTRSGAFTFDPARALVRAARPIVAANPGRFVLAPNSARVVGLTWRTLPRGTRAAALGIVFEGVPQAKRGPLKIVSRLLSVNLLRLPGRYLHRGTLLGVTAAQGPRRSLRFLLRTRNTGQSVDRPSKLALSIRTPRPRRRARERGVRAGAAARRARLPDRRAPKLRAGTYRVTAALRFGRTQRTRAVTTSRLAAPSLLAKAAQPVSALAGSATVGDHAVARLAVSNSGTAATALRMRVRLYRMDGAQPSARPVGTANVSIPRLGPGDRRDLETSVGHDLARGDYRLVADYSGPGGDARALVADFGAVPHVGVVAQVRGWVDRNATALVGAIALVLLLALGTILLRRQRRLQAELAHARRSSHERG